MREEVELFVTCALSEPPRFASLWACSSHRFLAPPGPERPVIRFDNESSLTGTVIRGFAQGEHLSGDISLQPTSGNCLTNPVTTANLSGSATVS